MSSLRNKLAETRRLPAEGEQMSADYRCRGSEVTATGRPKDRSGPCAVSNNPRMHLHLSRTCETAPNTKPPATPSRTSSRAIPERQIELTDFPPRSSGFESPSLHISVSIFSEMSENRSISARVRAIYDHAWTRRTTPAARIRRIQQNLSGRDLARSMDHRRRFACGQGWPDPQTSR